MNLVQVLAARALGREPSITPRTGSLFEERVESSLEQPRLMEVIDEITTRPRIPAVASSQPAMRGSQSRDSQRLPAAPNSRRGHVSEPAPLVPANGAPKAARGEGRQGERHPNLSHDAIATARSDLKAVPAGARTRQHETQDGRRKESPRPAAAVAPVVRRTRSPEDRRALGSSTPTDGPFSIQAAPPSPEYGTGSPSPGVLPTLDRPLPDPSAAASSAATVEQWPATSKPQAQARTPEESVINVTIGRIEVRAIHAPPTKPLAPKPPPFPSLDEYLHRTGEGRVR